MPKLPVYSSKEFDWARNNGTTSVERLGITQFPKNGFYIESANTKQQRLFMYDAEVMEANEFFDGEASAYFCPGGGFTVKIWV